jgi:hypothetical protein
MIDDREHPLVANEVNLQPLFPRPIRYQSAYPDIHIGHASSVWMVETDEEEVVVRTTRMREVPMEDFWWGIHHLFGVDPTHVFALEPLNDLLNQLSSIPVPRVLRKGHVDEKPYVVVEKMPGQVVTSFAGLPLRAAESLGEALARIHSRSFPMFGLPTGAFQYPPASFHERLVDTLRGLVSRFYKGQDEISDLLEEICGAAMGLPVPDFGSLIMMDMDPTQFLSDGQDITALIDTECCCVGPRALELVALEYLFDADSADAFASGYCKVCPFPDLSEVRPVYRYLNRLLRVQGDVDILTWMSWPTRFG